MGGENDDQHGEDGQDGGLGSRATVNQAPELYRVFAVIAAPFKGAWWVLKKLWRAVVRAWEWTKRESKPLGTFVAIGALVTSVLLGANQYIQVQHQIESNRAQQDSMREQSKAQNKQIEMAIAAQLSERYFRAVSMLASDQLEVRLVALDELLDVLAVETKRDKTEQDIKQEMKDQDRIVHVLAEFATSHAAYPCESRPDPVREDVQEAIEYVGTFNHGLGAANMRVGGNMPSWDEQGGQNKYDYGPPKPMNAPRH